MEVKRIIVELICLFLVNAKVININENGEVRSLTDEVDNIDHTDDTFNGVYAECFLQMSFPCVQRKTLMYLKQLNNLSEVSVIGDYVKFVKLNASKIEDNKDSEEHFNDKNTEELTHMIDRAIDNFFDNHIIRFSALGRETSMPIPNNVEEFVGRKKRKGGGMGGGGGHDGGDFGKKKMMMMAMMCMKMKLMMMVPAMMGMMGMMSFKGMMFSMMAFMISKMMLLMKILEKKGGIGGAGGGGGGGDGGWAAGGGGGGAWMPAGGPDYGGGGGGGGGGGYDANGQWQSRSILDFEDKEEMIENKPIISYVAPVVRYNNDIIEKRIIPSNQVININKNKTSSKSRRKRSIIDVLQNSYMYWMNKLLGINNNRRTSQHPKYKIVNGVKYVFYPFRQQKVKSSKEIQTNKIKTVDEGFKPIITAEDFNKGEIIEGAVESRMSRKKLTKMKNTVNDTLDDNPWE